MSAPALLVAARARFLASDEYALLDAAGVIGSWQSPPQPWVFIGTDPRNGLPWAYGTDLAAVTIYARSRQWHTNDTSARFPVLGVTVWVQGDPATPDAEWLARNVAEAVVSAFDDPANQHTGQWTDDVRVIRCRWSGELSVSEVENMPGFYRADCSFEIETA